MPAEVYCEPEQVRKLLRLPAAFSSTTNPSTEQVYNLIHRKMALIDYRTKTSFRTQQAQEYHDIDGPYEYLTGVSVFLNHRNIITPLSSGAGDSLKVFNGSNWEEFVNVKTENRANDFWFDERLGILFLKTNYWNKRLGVDIKYRHNSGAVSSLSGAITSGTDAVIYADNTTTFPQQGVLTISGEKILYNSKNPFGFTVAERGAFDTIAAAHSDNDSVYFVPEDIEECCAKLVAIDILTSDDWSSGGSSTGEMPSGQNTINDKVNAWQKDVDEILARYSPTVTAIR